MLAQANPVRRLRDDRLDRADFARAIATIVRAPRNDGLVVIGVEGPWGAGKSSVLSMAASELARDRRNRIVTISAWRTSSQDQFLSSLSYSLTTALRRDWQSAPWRIALAKFMRQSLLTTMAIFLPLLTLAALIAFPDVREWVRGIVETDPKKLAASLGLFGLPLLAFAFSKLSQPALDSIKQLFGSAKLDAIGSLERFAFDFDVLAAAQPRGSRFVVLVEDLDRCAPDHLTDVLSAIAQMWSHPKADRIAFLLAYDRVVVLKGLAQGAVKHLIETKPEGGPATAEALDVAADYLDRVVQLELPLPNAGESLGAEEAWSWPVVRASVRGVIYSVAVVAAGLYWLATGPARCVAGWTLLIIALLYVVDLVGSRVLRPDVVDAAPDGWDDAVGKIGRWLDGEPLRVRARVLNRAGAALSLRSGSGLTAWEAVSIAALATRWPHAFGVASLAASRDGPALDIQRNFGEANVTAAIEEMRSNSLGVAQFEDANKLYSVVSSFKR